MTAAQWNPDFYKTGYEGFERLENFPTAESLDAYRKHLLDKTAAQVAFIAKQLGKRPLRVFEIGSGNGRLLVALALRGMLERGIGIDISQSRIRFAQRWISDLGISSIQTAAADALTFDDFAAGDFDLAACITGAFGYLRAIRETAPAEVLGKMRRSLRDGGKALLELYQMPASRKQMLRLGGGRFRTWQPLPPEDRFAYYLDDFEYWQDLNVLRHGKIFIARDGSIDAGREEVLTYYTRKTLSRVMNDCGFEKPRFWSDFEGAAYREGQSAALVALATTTNEGNQ